MTKALINGSLPGWQTKGSALLAEDMDDNFLALEDAYGAVGTVRLEPKTSPVKPGWEVVDSNTSYPQAGPAAEVTSNITSLSSDGIFVKFLGDDRLILVTQTGVRDISTADWTSSADVYTFSGFLVRNAELFDNGNLLVVTTDASPYMVAIDTNSWTDVSSSIGLPALKGQAEIIRNGNNGQWALVTYNKAWVGTFGGVDIFSTVDWSLVKYIDDSALGGNSLGSVYDAQATPDGTEVTLVGSSSPYVRNYETAGWTYGTKYSTASRKYTLEYSPDGLRLYLCNRSELSVEVSDTSDGSAVSWTNTVSNGASQVRFSADGNYYVLADDGGGTSTSVILRTFDYPGNTQVASTGTGKDSALASSVALSETAKYGAFGNIVSPYVVAYEGGSIAVGSDFLGTEPSDSVEWRVRVS